MPSLVAELGFAIETHLKKIRLLKTEELSKHQKQILAEGKAQFEAKQNNHGLDSEYD